MYVVVGQLSEEPIAPQTQESRVRRNDKTETAIYTHATPLPQQHNLVLHHHMSWCATRTCSRCCFCVGVLRFLGLLHAGATKHPTHGNGEPTHNTCDTMGVSHEPALVLLGFQVLHQNAVGNEVPRAHNTVVLAEAGMRSTTRTKTHAYQTTIHTRASVGVLVVSSRSGHFNPCAATRTRRHTNVPGEGVIPWSWRRPLLTLTPNIILDLVEVFHSSFRAASLSQRRAQGGGGGA